MFPVTIHLALTAKNKYPDNKIFMIGDYENALIKEFEEYLPEIPQWK